MPPEESNNTETNVTPTPAQEVESVTNQSGTITPKDLEAMEQRLLQFVKTQNAQLYQGVQSLKDKFSAKMEQKMSAFESAAKAAGVQLTEADRQQYQTQAKLEIINQQASGTPQSFVYQPGQVVPQDLTDEEFAAGVEAAAVAIFKANEIEIKRGDPEDAIIAAAEDKSPDEYLKAVQQAISTKKARLGTSTTAQPTPTPATNFSPGLVGGTPSSNPLQSINDPHELYRKGFAKS